MKIKKLDITGFGKFHNKTVEFQEGINIIYGENESGKTTIHNFIDGMFYGFLKPNVKSVRYLDEHTLYEPWNRSKYAGIVSLEYKGEEYRIEREFTKGNESTKVYLESTGEEITGEIDLGGRTRILQPGYHFFGFNGNVFRNTISIKQLKTQTEEDLSKEIKEKLANVTHSLDEKISVKKAIKSLENDLKDIGSERAPTSKYGRTISYIYKLKEDIGNINQKRDQYDNLLMESKKLEEQLEKSHELLEEIEYLELKNIYDKGIELDREIKELEDKGKTIKSYLQEDDYKNNQVEDFTRNRQLSLMGMIATVVIFFILGKFLDMDLFIAIARLVIVAILGAIFFKNTNLIKKAKILDEEKQKNYLRLKADYEINTSKLESQKVLYNREMGNHSLETLRKRLSLYTPNYDIDIDSKESLVEEISNIKLNLVRNEENINNIEKDLNSLVILEEELKEKENLVEEMDKEIAAIELAKSTIEKLSKNIHEDFAPHINSKVSSIISKITKEKYSNIKVDDKLVLGILNPESREILKVNSLSGGTIDQLYFALRCGIISSISEENLPLILDDCFIQYDDNRLKNVLEFLIDISKERQIILFTCHNREKDILKKLDVGYNMISL